MPKEPQGRIAIRPEDQNLSIKQQINVNEEMHALRAWLERLETGRERFLLSDGRDNTQEKIAELRKIVPYLEQVVRYYVEGPGRATPTSSPST